MPKIVDHQERRTLLVDATARIILRSGISAVTVRAVSAEAGWSTGALRYYFPDQASLRDYAVASLAARLSRDVEARIRKPHENTSPIGLVASVLEELLPLDEQRREEYVLWEALVTWERETPEHLHSRMWEQQRSLYRWAASALAPGPHPPDHPPLHDERLEIWVNFLHVFVDGLASQMIQTPAQVSPDAATQLLRGFLNEAAEALRANDHSG